MSENIPIPDDSVRSYAAWGGAPAWDLETGDDLSDPEILQSLLIQARLTARDLAREVMALRELVRGLLDGGAVFVYDPTRDRKAEARALLPEPEPR